MSVSALTAVALLSEVGWEKEVRAEGQALSEAYVDRLAPMPTSD